MKRFAVILVGLILVVALLVISGAFYVVDETQQVVITQFGEPRGEPKTTPGLKFKLNL